jgi:hypothetical protein
MSTTASPEPRTNSDARAGGWLLNPTADLLLIANLIWPFVFLIVVLNKRYLNVGLELFLASAIGTPHRWITLPLVANDRVRLQTGGAKLAWVTGLTALFYACVWRWLGGLPGIVLATFLWQVWHVAAQHAGLARVYAVRGRPDVRSSGVWEKTLLRAFVCYAFVRMASQGGALRIWPWLDEPLRRAGLPDGRWDWLSLAAPVFLLGREFVDFDRRLLARYAHYASVCAIYTGVILFSRAGLFDYALSLSAAIGVFHAVEYFGFITWAVETRREPERSFFQPWFAAHWRPVLAVFLAAMAAATLSAAFFYPLAWLATNSFVSMLHYAYDGVIWKMPAVFQAKPA